MARLLVIFLFVGCFSAGGGCTKKEKQKPTPSSPKSAEVKEAAQSGVYFKNLKEGDRIQKGFEVEFGVRGMRVKPAGELQKGTGHHHIIVDSGFMTKGEVIPSDENHLHFGDGSEKATLDLTPGMHTITLQFADGAHRSYGRKWSQTLSVVVAEDQAP